MDVVSYTADRFIRDNFATEPNLSLCGTNNNEAKMDFKFHFISLFTCPEKLDGTCKSLLNVVCFGKANIKCLRHVTLFVLTKLFSTIWQSNRHVQKVLSELKACRQSFVPAVVGIDGNVRCQVQVLSRPEALIQLERCLEAWRFKIVFTGHRFFNIFREIDAIFPFEVGYVHVRIEAWMKYMPRVAA